MHDGNQPLISPELIPIGMRVGATPNMKRDCVLYLFSLKDNEYKGDK